MGVKHKEQLSDCYHFINSILNMEYDTVFKEKCAVIKPKSPKNKYPKRIRIHVNQVSNFEIRDKLLAI
jgi:hypothetical protein